MPDVKMAKWSSNYGEQKIKNHSQLFIDEDDALLLGVHNNISVLDTMKQNVLHASQLLLGEHNKILF